jgi:hypothetical protein
MVHKYPLAAQALILELLTISEDLSFNDHITNIVSKARQCTNTLLGDSSLVDWTLCAQRLLHTFVLCSTTTASFGTHVISS